MKILFNPLRLLMCESLASYPSVLSFYEDFLKRLRECFPRGMIDAMNFIERETSYKDKVLKRFCSDFSNRITPEVRDWFFDDYILEINWRDKHESKRRLKWLADTLILVVNHKNPYRRNESENGNSFDDAFDSFCIKYKL